MKYIIRESQLNFIKESYEDEMKKYQEVIRYRNNVCKKIEEIWNINSEIEHIFHPKFAKQKIKGVVVMDFYIKEWRRDRYNNVFKCDTPLPKKNEINPSNFFKTENVLGGLLGSKKVRTKLSSEDSRTVISLYNQIINKIKELDLIKSPVGTKPVACMQAWNLDSWKDDKTKKEYIMYVISFRYPLVPIPKKPKKPIVPIVEPQKNVTSPVTQKQTNNIPQSTTNSNQISGVKNQSKYSVFGPSNSLIGFMDGRNFTPATGSYAVGMNKSDKDLLNNKVELNKYVQSKFGGYANPIQ